MENINIISFLKNLNEVYELLLNDICQKTNISHYGANIISLLYSDKSINTPGEIAKALGLKPNKLTFHLNALVLSGYVKRCYTFRDKRKIKLQLTSKANNIVDEIKVINDKFIEKLNEGLSEEHRVICKSCLEVFNTNLVKMRG